MNMTEKTFMTDELAINYAEGPENGPPLLLLHGSGSVWEDWEPVIEHFQNGWHIFAPDFRGCGKSGRSLRGNYSNDNFKDDIIGFIDTIIMEAAVIIGHSMGAIIGMQLAAEDDGERVKALVLEDPPLYLSEFFKEWMWYPYYPVAVEALKAGLSEAEIAKALSDKLDFAEVDAEKEAKSLVRIDPEIVYRVHNRSLFKEFNADSDLKNISCPLLLLHGEWKFGSAMRPDDVRRGSAFLPKGSVKQISGAGHSIHIANCRPDVFNEAVGNFLSQL